MYRMVRTDARLGARMEAMKREVLISEYYCRPYASENSHATGAPCA